jgi:hypothetical protein
MPKYITTKNKTVSKETGQMKISKTLLLIMAFCVLSTAAYSDTYKPLHYWLKVGAIFAGTKEALEQARTAFYVEGDTMAYSKMILDGTEGNGPIVSMPLKTPMRIFLRDIGFLGMGNVSFHFNGDPDTYWASGDDIVHN